MTYYVPIERADLPQTNPLRWFILAIETDNPVDAMREASITARDTMGLKPAGIWAAVRDIPSFEYMASLRCEFDAARRGRR